jgi:hypothetical protein
VEVADVVRAQGDRFIEQNRSWLSYQQLAVLRALAACRTSSLGGHIDRCSKCGHQAVSYNSCRNRHCPKCQAPARQRWLAAREQELLGVTYFPVVFTLPQELNPLCQWNAKVIYNLLFRARAETRLDLAADPKHLGAKIGFLSILHTWGQNLSLHPNVHCLVPAGGLSPDHQRWIRPQHAFFLPVKVLGRMFRQRFVRGLRRAYRRNQLVFGGPRWPMRGVFKPLSTPSLPRIGSSTPSLRWAVRVWSYDTSGATPTGSRSAITDCSPLMARRLLSAGRTMPTTTKSAP